LATDIAFELREKGRSKRIANPDSANLLDGEIVRNEDGSPVKVLGKFKDVKAIGWYMDTFNRSQISINFNNYKKSTIHDVFDEACALATERGVRVTGSELVGLIPLEALLMAGRYYLKKQNRSTGVSEKMIVETAAQETGQQFPLSFFQIHRWNGFASSNNIVLPLTMLPAGSIPQVHFQLPELPFPLLMHMPHQKHHGW
jgi:hypothetical protein